MSRDTANGSPGSKIMLQMLPWEWHCNNAALTNILCSLFPEQIPAHFSILPLPSEISSWLISLLLLLPMNKLLWEENTTANLKPGGDGKHTAHQLDAATFSWTSSLNKNKFSCLEHLQLLSGQDSFLRNATGYWLREQSEVPSHIWYRPSGQRADRTQQKMGILSLASFYQDFSEPSDTEIMIPKKSNKRPIHSSGLTNKQNVRLQRWI